MRTIYRWCAVVNFFGQANDRSLDVYPLSDRLWRVCDARKTMKDPARLIGYVQRLDDDRFEVFLRNSRSRQQFTDTITDALILMKQHRDDQSADALPAITTPRAKTPFG